MKTIYFIAAAALIAGLSSCYGPYAPEAGTTPMRTSGAYSSQFRGQGSNYHSWDRRDPTGDWRHDDRDDEDDDGDSPRYRQTRYASPDVRYSAPY